MKKVAQKSSCPSNIRSWIVNSHRSSTTEMQQKHIPQVQQEFENKQNPTNID